ncbi:MAG: hypothetical protein AAB527_00025 [Patescibacteria group bacterium]
MEALDRMMQELIGKFVAIMDIDKKDERSSIWWENWGRVAGFSAPFVKVEVPRFSAYMRVAAVFGGVPTDVFYLNVFNIGLHSLIVLQSYGVESAPEYLVEHMKSVVEGRITEGKKERPAEYIDSRFQ